MKKYVAISVLLSIFCSCKEASTVHLKGQVEGADKTLTLAYDGASAMLGNSRDITINLNQQGHFDTIITINKPEYYNINRTQLCLTPGDDLEIQLNSSGITYNGKGAEVNTYLSQRPFATYKFSFDDMGDRLSDFKAAKVTIDSIAEASNSQIEKLANVSQDFKYLEKARVQADQILNYIYSYNQVRGYRDASREEYLERERIHLNEVVGDYVRPLMKNIVDEKYLDLSPVRRILWLSEHKTFAPYFTEVLIPAKAKELLRAFAYSNALDKELSTELVGEVKGFIDSIKYPEFIADMQSTLAKSTKRLPGQPAIDISMVDAAGKAVPLSSYKGKVLYIDFWATWCGPCREEAPYFEKLKKAYEGQDIVFISISVDARKADWDRYIAQQTASESSYIITKESHQSNEWRITTIPRFVLIDKNFNIANADAERPSSEEIKAAIDALLKENNT